MSYSITTSPRQVTGRKNWKIRVEGKIPAVVYGFEIEPQNIELDRNAFVKLYNTAGASSVVELDVDGGKKMNVLIQEFQQDPITGFVTHVDFRSIDMKKSIEADVKFNFVGEPAAVKSLGGTLVRPMDRVTIKALPKDLITSIEVDLTKLATFEDVIRVADLVLPAGVESVVDGKRTIASVTPPRSLADVEALDDAVDGDVSVVEKDAEKPEAGEDAEKTEEKASK